MTLLKTLSGRLLALTVLFVMVAEVLIFVPSVARFRVAYLSEILARAEIAALALKATPENMVEPELEAELLATAGVLGISLKSRATRELVLQPEMKGAADAEYDLSGTGAIGSILDAFATFAAPPGRVIRVMGPAIGGDGLMVDAMMPEDPLRAAMFDYGRRIFLVSLAISLFTALLLFVAIRSFITRPILRVTANMTAFRDQPEDAGRIIRPSSPVREVFEAERALQDMETRVLSALRQRERLAALGAAVARIGHDLRNLLTTAQLLADRIETSRDPAVARVAPKLLASLDRAIQLCERTLAFGRAEEPAPVLRHVRLEGLAEDVAEAERLAAPGDRIVIHADIAPGLVAEADPEQLFRVLGNLVRNARQAIAAASGAGRVEILGRPAGSGAEILVRDTGPGLPSRILDHLFEPFAGGARTGGSGLGLAIAAELVRAQGGTLELVETSTAGTTFRIRLQSPGSATPTLRLAADNDTRRAGE